MSESAGDGFVKYLIETEKSMITETDKQIAERVLDPDGYPISPKDIAECARRLFASAAENEVLREQNFAMNETIARLNEPVGGITAYNWLDVYDMAKGSDEEKSWVRLDDHLKAMRARVPEGWQLVPREPTEEMLANAAGYFMIPKNKIKYAYAAFLEVAPKPE